MLNATTKFDEKAFAKLFEQSDFTFLQELEEKKDKIIKDINNTETKKRKVIKQISEEKKDKEKEPKQLREYINNSESALESIEIIYDNLNKILNEYRSIEKNVIIIYQKFGLNVDNPNIKEDVKVVSTQISETKNDEESIKLDNEKNYIIVNSLLDKKINDETIESNNIDLEKNKIEDIQDNLVLKICEKRVELPYTKKEIEEFIKEYPKNYKTPQDVINKEFIIHIAMFNKHPILSRFKEAYYLCRTKEMMSVFDSFNYAKSIMFKSNLNAYIIAASKSKKQLEEYMECLETNTLDKFKYFKIIFAVNPLSVN